MKYTPLNSANSIYDCARMATILVHSVEDTEFHKFCLSLREFKRSLGDLDAEDYWRKFLRPLKNYCFDISSTLLPFDYPMTHSPKTIKWLQSHVANCDMIFPRLAEPARALLDNLITLSLPRPNPILAECEELCSVSGVNVAILVKESRHIPPVERLLQCQSFVSDIEVIGPSQLRSDTCHSKLIILGPGRWFPNYVFQSPRSSEIHIVKYRWVTDLEAAGPVFTGSLRSPAPGTHYASSAAHSRSEGKDKGGPQEDTVDADEFLSSLDWDSLFQKVPSPRPDHPTEEEEEYTDAWLFQVEGDLVVPLDAAEGATAAVIDLSQEGTDRVRRIPVANIEPDMFLLVRKGGGGEYIVPVANRILDDQATGARQLQREWKNRLRRVVNQRGLQGVIRELKKHGSIRANEVNVRNWKSYRSIKTQDYQDFRAIMRLVELEDESDNYWKTMVQIDRAHTMAGQQIRKLLLRQVRTSDLPELEKLGKMDFELPDVEGVSLEALRIKNIYPQAITIHVSSLGHPVEVDSELWLK